MITKEKLKQTIELIIELNGSLTLSYVPSSDLKNPKGPYGWYYGGSNKIEISREFYRAGRLFERIEDLGGVDFVVDDCYKLLTDSVHDYIFPALNNLGLDDTDLKYFDRDKELFKKFKNEINRLKCGI